MKFSFRYIDLVLNGYDQIAFDESGFNNYITNKKGWGLRG